MLKDISTARRSLEKAGLDVNTCSRTEAAAVLKITEGQARHLLDKLRIHAADQFDAFKWESERSKLQERLREALERQVLNQDYEDFVSSVASRRVVAPPWTLHTKLGTSKQGMPVAHLSDTHFDEVVDPRQVEFVNGYNRKIAEARLRLFFEKTISLCDDYLKGLDYPGIVLAASGDLLSGEIHDELRETNETPMCESVLHWAGKIASGLKMWADRFGKVHVFWVVGNHPRTTRKPRAKGAVRSNFDWLLGGIVMNYLARENESRISINLSDSFDCNFRIYGTRFLQTHGDQFKGGSGIAAELSPMLIGDARKRERQQAVNVPYDVMIAGHWHRRLCLERIKLNGALVGYDEYAYRSNFKFQPPVQSFAIVDPKHGVTIEAPIHVKADNEGWEQPAAIAEVAAA